MALHKKWSFPLRIFLVNVTKSAVNCKFGHIYWRNPYWKTSFLGSVTEERCCSKQSYPGSSCGKPIRVLKAVFKGSVRYTFTSFCMSKRKLFRNKEKCLFHFDSSFSSWENQVLTFHMFKCHDAIKCLNMKPKIHFTEW